MVRLTGGTYFIGQPIKIGSNIDFLMDRDVVLVRNFAGRALSQATIVNEAGAAGNSNIRLSGGTITTQGNTSAVAGKHLGFDNVKNLSIDDVRFPRVYQHWTAAFRDCQDVTISNVVIGDGVNSDDEIHEDGLHFAGRMRITITNANI